MALAAKKKVKKVVLAYSGGLDTSAITMKVVRLLRFVLMLDRAKKS